jgi:hypothetical protein
LVAEPVEHKAMSIEQAIPIEPHDAVNDGEPMGQPMADSETRLEQIACQSELVTKGSLADQYNHGNRGRDPISFFYPYGYLY